MFYKLERHEAVACDASEWELDPEKRRVALTDLGFCQVSTVFLGVDHSVGRGHLVLFETMVFYADESSTCYRYRTWEEAEEGHKQVVERLSQQPSQQ